MILSFFKQQINFGGNKGSENLIKYCIIDFLIEVDL